MRVSRRYSQREISSVLSIKQPSYGNIERGHTLVSAAQLAILADFYRVPVALFYQSDTVPGSDLFQESRLHEQLCEQIKDYKTMLEIYQKRIEELEAKVTRKVVLLEYWFLYATENYSLRL
ncbi:helix-turn-helix domain-containing protein [Parapedobacter sp. GCM10030251]|uniref:helix-turn-helix domain-containing protein n=1 Tax=Parapedobacter sp. GCM10030251 TaxID=3273419 RepID=UPI0036222C65